MAPPHAAETYDVNNGSTVPCGSYAQIDESSENPHWRAIGVQPADRRTAGGGAHGGDEAATRRRRGRDLINLTDAFLPSSLAVTDDTARNVCRVECDVAIVGSGCGGGMAAAVLAGACHKVVVIEKGNYFTSRDYTSFEGLLMNQLYESGGFITTMNGGGLLLAGSSTVGGVSAVNWPAYLKTPEFVLREWAAAHGLPLSPAPSLRLCHRHGQDESKTQGGRMKIKLDVKMDFDERTMLKMDFDDSMMLKIDFDVMKMVENDRMTLHFDGVMFTKD
uniref:Uncharacterized protein n=1 Tax=Oryza meridionalis TaxID=40149 RepID=A0A0E0EI85_9ORYZ